MKPVQIKGSRFLAVSDQEKEEIARYWELLDKECKTRKFTNCFRRTFRQ
ncbi:MAG: hypothetical protein ABIH41_04615 [Nanoarchaeota archaeon]